MTIETPSLAAKAPVETAANAVAIKAASAVEMRSFFTGFLPLDLECRLTPVLFAGPFGIVEAGGSGRPRGFLCSCHFAAALARAFFFS
ncbi:hypothetical protein [Mesorhizobium sp.]|uniref:hypothetical protein n=1 Tax=Mesorhizobium sp. TaxID=1871066 RepID=UPI0025C0F438|nr:hypothetical protein [Mesorhizobium sp.]